MLLCKFDMSDGIRDTKLLALIDYGALFNFMSFSVAKFLGWLVRPNTTQVAVKLANERLMHTLGAANGLILHSALQAYAIFLVVDVLFDTILGLL